MYLNRRNITDWEHNNAENALRDLLRTLTTNSHGTALIAYSHFRTYDPDRDTEFDHVRGLLRIQHSAMALQTDEKALREQLTKNLAANTTRSMIPMVTRTRTQRMNSLSLHLPRNLTPRSIYTRQFDNIDDIRRAALVMQVLTPRTLQPLQVFEPRDVDYALDVLVGAEQRRQEIERAAHEAQGRLEELRHQQALREHQQDIREQTLSAYLETHPDMEKELDRERPPTPSA